jgi:hypothetical protein
VEQYPEVPNRPSIGSLLLGIALLGVLVFAPAVLPSVGWIPKADAGGEKLARSLDPRNPTNQMSKLFEESQRRRPGQPMDPETRARYDKLREESKTEWWKKPSSPEQPESPDRAEAAATDPVPQVERQEVLDSLSKEVEEPRLRVLLTAVLNTEVRAAGGIAPLLLQRRGLFAAQRSFDGPYVLASDIAAARGLAYTVFGTKALDEVEENDFQAYFRLTGASSQVSRPPLEVLAQRAYVELLKLMQSDQSS